MSDETEFAKLDVLDRLAKIEKGLLQQDPELPTHLRAIHKNLIQYEELVHLLDDSQIRVLMQGQQKHVGLILHKEAVEKKSTRRGKITLDDI